MTLYAYVPGDVVESTAARPNWLDDNGEPLTDTALASHHWYPVQDADPIPEGKTSTGQAVEWVDGMAKWVHALISTPVPTLAQRREAAIAALKEKRWLVEIAGVTATIGGEAVLISTARGDDRANLHIMQTAIISQLRPDGSTFNFADGLPRSVSNADMAVAIGAALGHVQTAFDRENEVTATLNAATTHAAMDDAVALIEIGWPD